MLFSVLCNSVFTPYYSETVLYSSSEIRMENEDGISILFYLQKIFPGILLVCLDLVRIFFFCKTTINRKWIVELVVILLFVLHCFVLDWMWKPEVVLIGKCLIIHSYYYRCQNSKYLLYCCSFGDWYFSLDFFLHCLIMDFLLLNLYCWVILFLASGEQYCACSWLTP